MESTAFFEKKLNLTPSEFNQVKNLPIDELLQKKAKEQLENKCSEQGFILPGSIKLISRSMGYFEAARFTGDSIYYVKLEGKVIYPVDGIRVVGEVIRKNKMGLYVDYKKAIRIQVPRDLHLGSEEYEAVNIGDIVEVELKRSKFQINDPYILASGIFITTKSGEHDTTIQSELSDTSDVENDIDTANAIEAEESEETTPEDIEEEEEAADEEEEEEEEEEEDDDEEEEA
jgi:hypothetical protein